MVRTLRSRSSAPPSRDSTHHADEVLDRTIDVLVAMGYSPRALAAHVVKACAGKREPTRAPQPELATYLTQLGQVVTHWYEDPEYLDVKGKPIPLPLRGARRSLSALIERALPGSDRVEAIQTLMRTRALRQVGRRYLPIRRFMSFAEHTPYAHAQSLAAIRGLLHTVQHNIASAKPSERLLERKAANLSIPIRALPAFHRYAKREAQDLLERIDNALIEQEVPSSREPTTSVHFVTFIYEDPLVTGSSPNRAPSLRRRRVKR